MEALSASEIGKNWLDRFAPADRPIAAQLVDEVLLVNTDELRRGIIRLLNLILGKQSQTQRPMALFAEREVLSIDGEIAPLFSNSEAGRATGPGIQPILVNPNDQEVGSEGPIANLITSYCRLHSGSALSHPGPDKMREARVGPIVIVTDFIGSGKRVWEMLESFRRVATLRSWRSYHLIEFYVVAYSGTEIGIEHVKSSRLKPKVITVTGCPTIFGAFSKTELHDIMLLCRRHPHGHKHPLGFLNSGALIAFSHGMPNNAPPILHSKFGGWVPLFPKRSTIAADYAFPESNESVIQDRVKRLLRIKGARDRLDSEQGRRWIRTMLVLAAVEQGARTVPAISGRTRINLRDVEETLGFTRIARWTTPRIRLTPLGRQELQRLRRRRQRSPILPTPDKPFYYPTQLRAR